MPDKHSKQPPISLNMALHSKPTLCNVAPCKPFNIKHNAIPQWTQHAQAIISTKQRDSIPHQVTTESVRFVWRAIRRRTQTSLHPCTCPAPGTCQTTPPTHPQKSTRSASNSSHHKRSEPAQYTYRSWQKRLPSKVYYLRFSQLTTVFKLKKMQNVTGTLKTRRTFYNLSTWCS